MFRIGIALSLLCVGVFYMVQSDHKVAARDEVSKKLPAKLIARHQQYPDCLKLNDPLMPQEDISFHARLDEETELYAVLCEGLGL